MAFGQLGASFSFVLLHIRNPLTLLVHNLIAACQKGLAPHPTQVSPHPPLMLFQHEIGRLP